MSKNSLWVAFILLVFAVIVSVVIWIYTNIWLIIVVGVLLIASMVVILLFLKKIEGFRLI